MTIDWSHTAVYNTIMSVATGIALLLILQFGKKLQKGEIGYLDSWVVGFAIPGIILTLTGAHMTLTWPLSKIGFPFDDIIFGEPVLAFGILLLAAAYLLHRRNSFYLREEKLDVKNEKLISERLSQDLPGLLKPISYFGAAMGLALIAIGIAGVTFQLFAAPKEEPISGLLADYPMVEASFISLLYAITGIGATLFPFILKKSPPLGLVKTVKILWLIAGIIFVLFGVMNYFTHIGLIVHTMN
ncbi:hypothetical protein MFLO_10129 [Listeria floridensis FSL S10-1187]|uniref:DUF981 family protein n=1 Tax=Listeria floridensis FSL S10-1187 TaxID=1265817 RepID=A0ABN0RE84_9LIST|nr:DUF981 family protein [Listeria floridensis]EUJ30750.1 hypothetical protein MFLO_10129 [Listeria floridensis FSL S10-1187]